MLLYPPYHRFFIVGISKLFQHHYLPKEHEAENSHTPSLSSWTFILLFWLQMVNIGLMIAGILGVIVGIVLIAPSGALGTALGAMFLLGGVGVFVKGLLRW
jgi:hypothetical protein